MLVDRFGSQWHRRSVFSLSAVSARSVPPPGDGTAGNRLHRLAVPTGLEEVVAVPKRGNLCLDRS